MAERIAFIVDDIEIKEQVFNFKYYPGFSLTQKQSSIKSLHAEISKQYNAPILEISTKSLLDLGVKLSAFNLMVKLNDINVPIENVFQASKVFEDGGPYYDLLFVSPLEAKKDKRIKSGKKILSFRINNVNYSTEPKTLFYDWIYCRALRHYPNYVSEIMKYSVFTDIEFNHYNSINCQARAAAIYVYLNKRGLINEALANIESFCKYAYTHYKHVEGCTRTIFTIESDV